MSPPYIPCTNMALRPECKHSNVEEAEDKVEQTLLDRKLVAQPCMKTESFSFSFFVRPQLSFEPGVLLWFGVYLRK